MRYSLTRQQQGLWFDYQFNPCSNSYNTSAQFHFKNNLDLTRFIKSANIALNFFSSLRTTFAETKFGQVEQIISANSAKNHIVFEDISQNLDTKSSYQLALKKITEQQQKPFDLKSDIHLRAYLVKYSTQGYLFISTTHHIITDGVSGLMIPEAIICAYNNHNDAKTALSKKFRQTNVGDYLAKYNQPEHQLEIKNAQNYWCEKLKNANLIVDVGNKKNINAETLENKFSLGKERYDLIKKYSKAHKTTPFIVISTLFAALIYRYFGQKDITMGYPVNIRPNGLKDIFGFYVSTYPLRICIDESETLDQLIDKITLEQKKDRQHFCLSMDQIVMLMDGSNNSGVKDFNIYVGQTILNHQPSVAMDGVELDITFPQGTIKKDLNFSYDPYTENLNCKLNYNGNIFGPEIITNFIKNYSNIIDFAIENSGKQAISKINYLSLEEKNLLHSFNNTKTNYPQDKCIHQLFEEQVIKAPNNIAVVFEEQKLTYQELNFKSNQLAHHLQSIGVKAETRVLLYLDRSLEMIISILAILKAGGAYVPIDPDYPEYRIQHIVKDSFAKFALTNSKLFNNLDKIIQDIIVDDISCVVDMVINSAEKTEEIKKDCKIICIDQITDQKPTKKQINNPISNVNSHNLAYIIYTSGSTGVPKGVMIEHMGFVNMSLDQIKLFGISKTDNCLQFASQNFDASVYEIFMALFSGASLIIIPNTKRYDKILFTKYINFHNITVAVLTPLLLRANEVDRLLTLKTLIVAGEPLKESDAIGYSRNRNFINAYGPTEASVCSTIYKINGLEDPEQTIPIGSPIANTQIYILDPNRNLLPIGMAGELHIAGDGLARGYLNQPKLTQHSFIANPFQTLEDRQDKTTTNPNGRNDRLYKTGDLAKWLPDGNIEYLGRIDTQVKIRGFRIELGEVENCLSKYAKIKEVVVVATDKTNLNDKQLVAYYVANEHIDTEQLRLYLKDILPDYMIPAGFVLIDKIPLTPNGKIDHKSLETRSIIITSNKEYIAPRNQTETMVIKIFAETLGIDTNKYKIGINDNFFELGGHSLLAAQLISNLRENFKTSVNIKALFENPVVKDFAFDLDKNEEEDSTLNLEEEAILDDKINPTNCIPANQYSSGNILLTGATGFVGSFLLAELLEQTSATIYCLVRTKTPKLNLEQYNLWKDQYESRIILIEGDLSRPYFNLEKQKFLELGKTIDAIFHNGAFVHHINSYKSLKNANVDGTTQILRFATTNKLKNVYHISTMHVFSSSANASENTAIENEIHIQSEGYNASKWVAEKLIKTAKERGVPCHIYRLGLITGDSKSGIMSMSQWFGQLLKSSILLQSFPIELSKTPLPILPVDYLAKFVVQLSHLENNRVFHLYNHKKISFGEIIAYHNASSDKKIDLIPAEKWFKRVHQYNKETGKIIPIAPHLELLKMRDMTENDNALLSKVSYDNYLTLQTLKEFNLELPTIDENIVKNYFNFLETV